MQRNQLISTIKTIAMDQTLYHFSLIIALPLMIFFGVNMILARTPEKKIYANFLLSRRVMGTALLVLSANYSVHYFCSPRLIDVCATILMNLATYFLCYWLFSSAMMTLLNKRYITRRRVAQHLTMWLAYAAMAIVVTLWVPQGIKQQVCVVVMAVWLIIYGTFLSVRLLRTYYKAVKMFSDNHSDDIGAYIRWLSIFTIWAIVFGVSCSALTFLPDKYVFLWVLSSIPFYIYLYCCYQNYMLSYEKVENAIEEEKSYEQAAAATGHTTAATSGLETDTPAYHTEIARRIKEWIDSDGFCEPGLTLKDLSDHLCTNRTYLSEYINSVYHMSFRDWITSMRIDFAKRRMKEHPEQKMLEISEHTGFLSLSHFTKTFTEKEGCSPARWRKNLDK